MTSLRISGTNMGTHEVELKGLAKVTAKGRDYYYAWRGGPRIMAEPGTPEFVAEFNALRSPEADLDRGKFGAWVVLYKASPDERGGRPYKTLAESTKKNWGPLLDAAQKHFGKLSVRHFDRPEIKKDIRVWRDKWSDTPRMADLAKQVLSRVCSFMVAEGVLRANPCEGIENLYANDRSNIIWTDDDLDKLCKAASTEVANAAKLASLTGLRQGDLLKLRWSEITALYIEKPTSKSRGKQAALIPLYADLRDLLAVIPKRADTVLTNTYGEPWQSGFHSSWDGAVKRAGLGERDLHFHDLRGTAATRLFRAGFTYREIAEIVGVSEEQVESWIKRYVKRDEIIRDRIQRLEHFKTEQARLKEQVENGFCKTGDKTDFKRVG